MDSTVLAISAMTKLAQVTQPQPWWGNLQPSWRDDETLRDVYASTPNVPNAPLTDGDYGMPVNPALYRPYSPMWNRGMSGRSLDLGGETIQAAPPKPNFFGSLRDGAVDWLSDYNTQSRNPLAAYGEPESQPSWGDILRGTARDVVDDINAPSAPARPWWNK